MPSEQEQLWLDAVIETGNPLQAVRDVYPECGKNASNPEQAIRTRMYQLRSKLKADLVQRVQEKLLYYSPDLIRNLKELAISAQSEAVKVSASKDLLDRAAIGIKADNASLGVSVVINRDGVGVQVNVNNPDNSTDNDDNPLTDDCLRVDDPQ